MITHGLIFVALRIIVVRVVLTIRVLAINRRSVAVISVDLHLLLLRKHKLGEAGLVISKVLGAVLVHNKVVVGIVVLTSIFLLSGLALFNLPISLLFIFFLGEVHERNLRLDLLLGLSFFFEFVTPQLTTSLLHLLLAMLPDGALNISCLEFGGRVLTLWQVIAQLFDIHLG